MSEPAFTPGPWRIGENSNGIANIVLGPDDIRRVAIAAFDGKEPDSRARGEANARLISASPDGYALAVAIEAYYSGSLDFQRPYVAMARAFLAKAEGRS